MRRRSVVFSAVQRRKVTSKSETVETPLKTLINNLIKTQIEDILKLHIKFFFWITKKGITDIFASVC